MSAENRQSVNLLDLLAFLLRWRKTLIISILLVCTVVAVISFVLPERYRSKAIIRGNDSSGSSIGSLISSKLGALGGIGGFAPGLADEAGRYLLMMLTGREMSSRVIEEFYLRDVYSMADQPIEEVIDMLASRTSFERDREANAVIINIEDRDPQRALDMANFYINELDKMNRDLTAVVAKEEREFIGSRLADARETLAMLEDSMTIFQLQTGVLDIEEQIKATVQAAATMEAQRLVAKAELEMKSQIFDPKSSEVEMLKLKLAGIDSSLATIIRHRGVDEAPDFLVSLLDSPEFAKRYFRLFREIEVQSLVVLYLTQQHEQQKIEAVRNTATISTVVPPALPTMRIWPKRGLMIVLAGLLTFVLASLICMIVEFFRNAAGDSAHPQHKRVLALRNSGHSNN